MSDAPLEDLMVAMDVVDTVRHRELIVDRELDAVNRRQRLIERLRQIYTAQGIEVTDAALEAGVDALEQERFAYESTPDSLSAKLARLYVRRDRWLKPVTILLSIALIVWLGWFFTVALPERRLLAQLPTRIDTTVAQIQQIAGDTDAVTLTADLANKARRAVSAGDSAEARRYADELDLVLTDLQSEYRVRIVSRPNEVSGVWRVPNLNPDARNYYLIVEAVTASGSVVPVKVQNEEDGRILRVRSWGLRVSEEIFEGVAADKRDDGIIQGDIIGSKASGQLRPQYRIETTGATITEW